MDNLQNEPADPQPDLRSLLSREVFQETIYVLSHSLPPPITADPVDEARRDRVAMAGVAALLPVNATEARLAGECVATGAWALHCLRLAVERDADFTVARQCRAQAMSLMREGKSTLRMLLKLQALRQATEADGVAATQADWVEHCALKIMAQVLSQGPVGGADAVVSPADEPGFDTDDNKNLDDEPDFEISAGNRRAETEARPDHRDFGPPPDASGTVGVPASGGRFPASGHFQERPDPADHALRVQQAGMIGAPVLG